MASLAQSGFDSSGRRRSGYPSADSRFKGQIETNYDAALAHETWVNIRRLALQQHKFQLANRAYGEDAIALFMLGDMAAAKKQIVRAYVAARYVFRDRAGQVRFASLIGTGMAENGQYKDALRSLDEAISLANKNSGAAYPSVANQCQDRGTARTEAVPRSAHPMHRRDADTGTVSFARAPLSGS